MNEEPKQNAVELDDLTPDWTQIYLNGGPPCFAVMRDDKRFCNRAERWEGHDSDHKFVSWIDFLYEVMLWGRAHHAQEKADLQAKYDRLAAWVNRLDSAYWLDLELARFETCEIGDEAGNVWKGETPMEALTAYLDHSQKTKEAIEKIK